MRDTTQITVPKWPFFVGDAAMLGLAYFVYFQSRLPLGHWEIVACCICVGLGALLGVIPFLLDHRTLLRNLEAEALSTATEKIQNLERLAAQISGATNEWENVHLQAEKTSVTAQEITERMAAEVRDFTAFMQKVNEGEKSNLRLEVEKLRRAENDWLQVLVHILDHVHALHAGAARSGQPRLAEQMTQFQNACRDAARRVGVVPFAPAPGDAFDAARHKPAESDAAPAADAVVGETLAAGFTVQGRLVRPAFVRIAANGQAEAAPAKAGGKEPSRVSDAAQNQLPLETPEPF